MKKLLRHFRAAGALVLAAAVLAGCATVPVTGRRQVVLLSPAQEMQLGMQSFEQMKRELPVSKDPALNELVQRVGKRIAAVASADMPDAQWEFVVFDSKEANAFCLPGGKVGVYTGIMPIAKDEAGLATVMGHEVAHAVARHGGERITYSMGLQGLGYVVDAATAQSRWHQAATTVYGLGSQVGVALPHSRFQENEADGIGLIYMARAGYDPEAAVQFWERFAEYGRQQGGEGPWFLRTHPVSEDRIRQIKASLPEARLEYARSKKS